MEQLKTNQQQPQAPPRIKVKLQTGVNHSVAFDAQGIEPVDVCNTIEYLAQSSLRATKELEQLQCKNSALFIICTTLILASVSFAIAFTFSRLWETTVHSGPRYEIQKASQQP